MFMDNNFLLESKTSKELFKATCNTPIYDYHCHLDVKQIADNL
jgi:glucuronate isomerase